jgi:signal transduction histidine kinase
MVIDDSKSESLIVKSLLSKKGASVHCFHTGLKALHEIRTRCPDLILLDVVMPDVNGFQLCRRIKRLPDVKHIPVVFITSLDRREDVLKGYEAGGVDYVAKPFRAEELLARVSVHLELALLHRERMHQAEIIKRAEQRLQRLSLAEGLAHNLNNLLAPLMGNLNWLQDTLKDEDHIEAVGEMLEIVRRLDRLTASLTGRTQQALQTFENLGPLLTEVSERFRLRLPAEIEFVTEFDENDDYRVSAQLETAISALLENARDAVAENGRIVLSTHRNRETDTLSINVVDNGCGMDEETVAKAFLPFFSTKDTVGAGLGLHTAQLIIERIGGGLALAADPAGGVSATIELPLDESMARATVRLPLDFVPPETKKP